MVVATLQIVYQLLHIFDRILRFVFHVLMGNKHEGAVVVLSDGRYFFGQSLGVRRDCVGEVCFTTGITGYQYTITDPSFAGQIVTFTFPHIGNVGVNHKDFECSHVLASGIIIRELPCTSHVSSYMDLNSWLVKNNLTGVYGLDTRALVTHLREHGTQNGVIHHFDSIDAVDVKQLSELAKNTEYSAVATELDHLTDYKVSDGEYHVCVVDFGAKRGILDSLVAAECAVTVIAATDDFASRILQAKPHGIVISNGPGNPADISEHALNQVRTLLDSGIPILGICLGHQLLAIAGGAETIKMHHGHRGSNHPVYNIQSQTVEVTSQNHSFTLNADTLPQNMKVTHISLFDGTIEGISFTDRPVFSVQYHPEGRPGPHDSHYIFKRFIDIMKAQEPVDAC